MCTTELNMLLDELQVTRLKMLSQKLSPAVLEDLCQPEEEAAIMLVVQITAWPAQGIQEGSCITDYEWGYLYFDERGVPHFDVSAEPTRAEILARWSHHLKEESIE